jgi:uncharacterized protein (DUF934 family)
MPDTSQSQQNQANLIRDEALEHDATRRYIPPVIDPEAPQSDVAAFAFPDDEPGWLVPLATWLQRDRALYQQRRHAVGLLISPDSDLAPLLEDQDAQSLGQQIELIAIDFPTYTDGRGYSLAQILRKDFDWTGELRAVGDVLIDTMHYMARCGFDAFLVKPSHDPVKALAALESFTVHYQKSYPAIAGTVARPALALQF